MLLFNRYEYNPQTDLIGKGGFSRVYKALDKKLNRRVALKIYKTGDTAERYSAIAEIQRIIDIDHPNISRYIDIEELEKEDAFGDKEKIQVCVMELLDGGNFASYYNSSKDLSVLKKLLTDVLLGLSWLHRNGIIHRDIKPANILIKQTVDGPVAKITDFGISKKSDSSYNSTSSALIVSIPYMAPEQLNVQKYGINDKVTYNIDLWSLGVTVYEAITGDVLFRYNSAESSEQIMNNILLPDLPEKINQLPQPFRDFVAQCIIKDAKLRTQKAEDLILLLQKEYPAIDTQEPVAETVNPDIAAHTTRATWENPADTIPVPGNVPADEDATRVIARPVLPSAGEETIDEDATRIIARPATADPDATVVLVQANKAAQSAPAPGQEKLVTLFNRYDYYPESDLIGKGGFSRVYKAYDKKLDRPVALKIYKTGEFSDRYSPIAEIRRVINLDHPNICRYLDIEEIEKKNPFGENEIIQVCVMELLDGGSLQEFYSKNNDLEILRQLLIDIIHGLTYLHKKGIIHRDIKPANILIKTSGEGPVAKITDFGISKASDTVNNNSNSALVVSIPYMAPEQLNTKKYGIDESISYNLDLWSLGVTLYEVITGDVLFKNGPQESPEQIMANIMTPGLPGKINQLPEPFKTVIARCVVKDARERERHAEALLPLLHTTPLAAPLPPPPGNDPGTGVATGIQRSKSMFLAGDEENHNGTQEPGKKRKRIFFLLAAIVIFVVAGAWFLLNGHGGNKNEPIIVQQNKVPQATIPAPRDTVKAEPDTPVTRQNTTRETKQAAPAKDIKAGLKYKLVISAEQACKLTLQRVSSGSMQDLGELLPGEQVSIHLATGQYLLKATGTVNPSLVVTTNLTILPENLGQANSFKVRFP